MNGHRFDITHGRTNESLVAAHFTSEGHTETDLSVMVIDVCWRKDTVLGKIRESIQMDKDVAWRLLGRQE